MESGVYRWRIVVAKDPGASTCVGVCTGDVSCPPGGFPFGKRANMWYFRSYRGGAYARGLELESTVQPFYSPGTVVEVRFCVLKRCFYPEECIPVTVNGLYCQLQYDANVGVLQISVNGEWQEAHITGITGMFSLRHTPVTCTKLVFNNCVFVMTCPQIQCILW